MKVGVLALTVFLWPPSVASAEWQVKPFVGVTFGGGTTLLEPEMAVGSPNVAVGINALLIGDMLGVEADLGYAPGFFQKGDLQKPLVVSSSTTTLTANVLIAVPRHLTQYTLRPYFVGGGGLMSVRTTTAFGVFDVSKVMPEFDVGVGVVGFLTNTVGVCWDLRRFQSIAGSSTGNGGISFGDERLSFWRATMAVAIRY